MNHYDSRLADECTTLRINLRHAVFNHETLNIGGGEFDAKLVSDILEMYIRISTQQGMQLESQKDMKENLDTYQAVSNELGSEVKRLKTELEIHELRAAIKISNDAEMKKLGR